MSMTLKQLNSRIAGLAKRNAKFNDDVQLVLVGCAQQAFDGSNVDPCTKLVNVLKGTDAKAIIHWIEAHMPAIWVKAEGKFRFNKSFVGEYDAITLMAEPWWELATKPAQVSSSFDVLESVRALIKKAKKEIESGKRTVEHASMIAQLEALAANNGEFAKALEAA